ncbi:carbohydrate binding family 9 domain-containing protein [Glaciecola sp. KUL10]|uniref:carbohydrate binding family 9 domain-containing protein n=1 Tax=Glaciecola sp. (strain KUL10) TaxID=2161813 RepID=UPI000D78BD57|nr:carbohydrate binding family 9 domain-containing protein [Glaciecola sp. KUL10]
MSFKKNFLACLLLVAPLCAAAQASQEPTSLAVPFIDAKPNIDGNLNDNAWRNAQTYSLAYTTQPLQNDTPPVKTSVSYFENGTTFFVAFRAYDPNPGDIRSFYRDRDNVWGQDLVGLKLDTYGDGRLAYQFFVNPFGTQIDSIENEMTGQESMSWNGIWESAGKITEDGYQVEIAIPLRLMNFQEKDAIKRWGIEFVRFYPRKIQYRLSHVPFDRNNSCNLCQMGFVDGFEKAKQGQNLAIVPTAVIGRAQTREPESSLDWDDSNNQELGLDVKWAITPEITLLGTLNPDFSQVEADVAQLSVNNTFALFFQERRPFFVENADYFSSDQNLIYTRNINAPDYGAKVTGRSDQHSLGLFVANDETTSFIVPGNLGSSIASLEDESTNLGLRYRYDYSDDLSIGTVVTIRDSNAYHNYVSGIDAKYRLSDTDTIRVQAVMSETEYPIDLFKTFCEDACRSSDELSESALRSKEATGYQGLSYRFNYRRNTNDYNLRFGHFFTDDEFRADLGFQSRVDSVTTVIGGGYNWWNENSWWNRIRINGDWDISHNTDGELIEKESEIYASIRGDYQTFAEIGIMERTRVGLREDNTNLQIDNNATQFSENRISLFFVTSPNQYITFDTWTNKGDAIDFANNRIGEQFVFEPEIELNIGKHMRLNFEHSYVDFDAQGQDLFTANLSDLRMTYQFDQRQLVRFTMAYTDIERNAANYLDEVDEHYADYGFQLLYSYKVNPLTKFFVGYSQSAFETDELNKLTVNGRSIFMKLSYAWLR